MITALTVTDPEPNESLYAFITICLFILIAVIVAWVCRRWHKKKKSKFRIRLRCGNMLYDHGFTAPIFHGSSIQLYYFLEDALKRVTEKSEEIRLLEETVTVLKEELQEIKILSDRNKKTYFYSGEDGFKRLLDGEVFNNQDNPNGDYWLSVKIEYKEAGH